jgi:peptidoglycan/LPS O-acetylase OafA/YrhL
MLLTSACYLLLGPHAGQMGGQEISLHRLLANATMMPQLFDAERIDGVYWTLELEIRFYFLIFVLLLLRQIGNIERWLYLWLAVSAWITLQDAPRWVEILCRCALWLVLHRWLPALPDPLLRDGPGNAPLPWQSPSCLR